MTKAPSSTASLLLGFVAFATAQLPYNPTQLFSIGNRYIYQLSADPVLEFSVLDAGKQIAASSQPKTVTANFPFQTGATAYVAASDGNGTLVLVGDCQDENSSGELWRFQAENDSTHGTWSQLNITTTDSSSKPNYLAAGFTFAATTSSNDTSFYAFGGMCPQGTSNVSTWTANADYSNSMVALSNSGRGYQASVKRSAPIAEAGLTITPLQPLYSTSSTKPSQVQNFVLIGGHTQNAFINMSQVAVYSLPTAGWSFVGVNQPGSPQDELAKRADAIVEPRSGHTSILSEDGTKIVVFGGWVGQVTSPATPQLAILEMTTDFDGSTAWSWTIPNQINGPFSTGQGVYGHGSIMLRGDVMMVSGGTRIGQLTSKRDISSYLFYNITSSTWSAEYANPDASDATSTSNSSSNTDASRRIGLGVGLGVGIAVLIIAIVILLVLFYRRKQRRLDGERRLRAMALGSEKAQSDSQINPMRQNSYPEVRSASWGSAQEKHIEGIGVAQPWPPSPSEENQAPLQGFDFGLKTDSKDAECTGLDVTAPSPTRGLRRNLHSSGPPGLGNHFGGATVPTSSVFRIDEEEETRSVKALQSRPPPSRLSDPFKDPPRLEVSAAAAERRKEVQSWVEDWQSAAENMNLSRSPSHARTYSNLSQAYSSSHSASDRGRSSPEKSDRTGSNLSERSNFSITSMQRSIGGGVTRTMSQRSISAGYALFAGAAAAMGRFAGGQLDRSASKRSVSLTSPQPRNSRPISGESRHGLLRDQSPSKSEQDVYRTPPESPIKDYKNYTRTSSLTGQGRVRARSVLGSVKRVFTGTSQVDVEGKVEHYEEVEKDAQDVPSQEPDTIETIDHPPAVPFWQGKKGARDWEQDNSLLSPESSTVRRRSGGRTHGEFDASDYDGEDWDVETAVQRRVVQVMFTVPKEKLRVVNADAISLLSRSDTGEREEDKDGGMSRMTSLKERDEGIGAEEKGKDKAKE